MGEGGSIMQNQNKLNAAKEFTIDFTIDFTKEFTIEFTFSKNM